MFTVATFVLLASTRYVAPIGPRAEKPMNEAESDRLPESSCELAEGNRIKELLASMPDVGEDADFLPERQLGRDSLLQMRAGSIDSCVSIRG